MKKSTIFIIAFLLISVTGSQVANFILRIKYNNIDRSDPFFGLRKINFPPFKYVKVCDNKSSASETVFIQPGDDFCLWTKIDTKRIGWSVESDTLFLEFKSIHGGDYDGTRPDFYVIAPHIDGVIVKKGLCKIKGWNVPNLNLQIGSDSGWIPKVMLAENTIDSLSVKLKFEESLKIGEANEILKKSVLKF